MKNILVKPDITITQAMKLLDETAEKVLLVVNEKEHLLGTITDGDIRRYILNGKDLKGTISKAYNKTPLYLSKEDYTSSELKQIFLDKKIELLPVIDNNGKVINYFSWESVFGNGLRSENKAISAPVIIMAGGKGTRLEPFTKVLPKPLIPVNEKPIIDYIIEQFMHFAISHFHVSVNYKAKIIKAYLEDKEDGTTYDFIEEEKPLGTAGSLKFLENKLKKPFFVSNCDIIVRADYKDLYNFHIDGNFDITLVASVKHYNIPYGTCELNDDGHLDSIIEKPEYSFLVNTGLYVVNPGALKLIPQNEFFHITQLIEEINTIGGSVGVYPINEDNWIDIGQWAEYRNAIDSLKGF